MGTITFEGKEFVSKEGETVLDCLLRLGVSVTNSCKSGVCHSCILKTTSEIEGKSQKGLSDSKKKAGLFLSCQQQVADRMEVFSPDANTLFIDAIIVDQKRVSDSVVVVKVRPLQDFSFTAGQFINIVRGDGHCRSYSIAGRTGDSELELHIRKVPNGILSNWFYDEQLINEKIKISEANGECSLTTEMKGKNLLLIGVGTGLAPLYGVVQDALESSIVEKINLIHGSFTFDGLYYCERLKELEQKNHSFDYYPLFLKGDEREGFIKGDIVEFVKKFNFEASNTIVMICGDPVIVKSLKQTIFLAGVPSRSILSDPFVSKY
ncbi:oxidoreductase NAD-binding domain protein [Bacteriovorax sp. BSW11_IV]|uniref:2Fe-2S iron-sulfur cluster-binding protein n=1 Tax=Bacteriovorax sp. BSW11_IV TaxID=1353529 RepID=UPI00038A539D|nr:2Fe-2S iron-sulfur cluster binding domain-containing protein [Bacteriovorax sp. BSW11_IV]EQC44997.1 oxidoreductase NAD-binding domain protein [Bacteriovorax sp. BSW11_IV]